MTSTMTKIGKSTLAALLAGFVCLTPSGLSAYAEGEDAAPQTATDSSTADAPQQDQGSASQGDASADAEAATAQQDGADAATQTSRSSASDDAASESDASGTDAIAEAAADEAEAEAAEDNPVEVEPGIFNVGTCLDLMDVYKYDINSQSGQSFTINLTDDITLVRPTDRVDTRGNRMVIGSNRLDVKNGNTVTILGHGHTIYYTDKSTNNLSLGAFDGSTLVLGSPAGGDSLTITFTGSQQIEPLITITNGGICEMNDAVTLSNNVNSTGLAGGAVCIQSGGTFNMKGGLIDNCTNAVIPFGGAVAVDGGTFNMTGGTITGCHEAYAQGRDAEGGGVVVGANGDADVFNMSGNAVIENCTASLGGGVCVGPNATFNMRGNAKISDCTATTNGGGVYVSKTGTFTMGDGNSITGCSAGYGGGVINFGTAVVTNVYDNDATNAGADVYNDGTITMEDVKADWSLSEEQSTSDPNWKPGNEGTTPSDSSEELGGGIGFKSVVANLMGTQEAYADTTSDAQSGSSTISASSSDIDGWYYDGHRETGETDADGSAVVEHNRWNANPDTADVPQYLQSYVATGQPTNETMGLKAAHGVKEATPEPEPELDTVDVIWENYDGAILFELDGVEADEIPAATEYNELSGNEDPTEPSTGNTDYEFEGWERTDEPNGNVIYTAMFDAVPDTHTDDPDPTPTPGPTDPDPTPVPDPDDPTPTPDDPTPDPKTDPDEPTDDPTVTPSTPAPDDPEPSVTDEQQPAPEPEATPATEAQDPIAAIGSLVNAGDSVLVVGFGLGFIALIAAGVLVFAVRRGNKDKNTPKA